MENKRGYNPIRCRTREKHGTVHQCTLALFSTHQSILQAITSCVGGRQDQSNEDVTGPDDAASVKAGYDAAIERGLSEEAAAAEVQEAQKQLHIHATEKQAEMSSSMWRRGLVQDFRCIVDLLNRFDPQDFLTEHDLTKQVADIVSTAEKH